MKDLSMKKSTIWRNYSTNVLAKGDQANGIYKASVRQGHKEQVEMDKPHL